MKGGRVSALLLPHSRGCLKRPMALPVVCSMSLRHRANCTNALQVPFSVAFPEMSPVMDTLVWIVDSIFFLDILVVASTPIHVHGDQCNDRKIIAKRYLKLHFWIDLLASIPFNRQGDEVTLSFGMHSGISEFVPCGSNI